MSKVDLALYLDDRRQHEILVSTERGPTKELVFRERVHGSSSATEVYVERHMLVDAWDERMHTLALESRLGLLGRYYRGTSAGWTPLRIATQLLRVDLRPLGGEGASDVIELHHFSTRAPQERHAVSLVAVHQDTPAGRRTLLVRLNYQFPDTQGGDLEVIHPCLPPVMFRSALMSLHLEMAQRRFAKLPPDAERMSDPRTWSAMQAALDAILARLVQEGQADGAGLVDALGRPLDASARVLVSAATRAARGAASRGRQYDVEFEVDEAASKVQGKKQEITIEELADDVAGAVNDPRLIALHARWLTPEQEKDLYARGTRAISAAIRDIRERTRPEERHLLSLLEASMILRHAFQNRISIDPEILNRVKHARVYL